MRWLARYRALRNALDATPRQVALYTVVYLAAGTCMNWTGRHFAIAAFAHWWQVVTCYGLYLVPVSLLVRGRTALEQYAAGVLALVPLELAGYALGSSIAYDGNVIDAVVGPRNFTLAMCVLFGVIPPLGNALVAAADQLLSSSARSRYPTPGSVRR